MPKNTPARRIDVRPSSGGTVLVGGSGGGGGVTDHGALTGLADNDHPQYLLAADAATGYVPVTRQVVAGAGLTGGGALSSDVTVNVNTGAGLSISSDAVTLASSVAGDGLTFASGVLAVGVSGLGLGVGADAVTLTSSSNPGVAAAILASNAGGGLTLQDLQIGGGIFLYGANNIGAGPDILFPGNGLVAAETSFYINIDSTNTTTTAALIIQRDAGTSAGVEIARLTEGGELRMGGGTPSITTPSGQSLTLAPVDSLVLTPGDNRVVLSNGKAIQTSSFVSGFAGNGFRLDQGISRVNKTSLELDDLVVRGRMSVYELLIRQIRATNGAIFVTSTAKVKRVGPVTGGYRLWTTTVEEAPTATTDLAHGFLPGDLLRAQRTRWNGTQLEEIYQCDLRVTTVDDLYTFRAVHVAGDVPEPGMEFVRIGSQTDPDRRGSLYLTADDTNAPFLDVVDGIASHSDWNAPGKVKVRLGKLTGITSTTNEYGIIAGTGFDTLDQYIKASNVEVLLRNVPLKFYDGATQKIHIGAWDDVWLGPSSSDKRLTWDGATLAIRGQIMAESGYIGTAAVGWTIISNVISSTNMRLVAGSGARVEVGTFTDTDTAGLSTGSASANVILWAGNTFTGRGSAPFRVTLGGSLTATDATFGTLKIDTSGAFVTAPTDWDLTYGYKFKVGAALTSGLAIRSGGTLDMGLWHNTTNDGVNAIVASKNTSIVIKNVASGSQTTSSIDLVCIRRNPDQAANMLLSTDGSIRRAQFGVDELTVGGQAVWHAGNLTPSNYALASHTHSYLPLSGGTLTGPLLTNETIRIVASTGAADTGRFIELGKWKASTNAPTNAMVAHTPRIAVKEKTGDTSTPRKLALVIVWPDGVVSTIAEQP